jgi:hypothetical protein
VLIFGEAYDSREAAIYSPTWNGKLVSDYVFLFDELERIYDFLETVIKQMSDFD